MNSDPVNFVTFTKERYHQHREMEQWCWDNVGFGKWIYEPYPKTWRGMPIECQWSIHSQFGRTTFSFRDSKNLTLFLLKWA